MTSPLGQTFAPTGSADDEISRKPNAAQQAIQVLSMRLPRVRGARSISPLLGEPGSAARRETPGGFSADSAVLQTLMRAQAPSAAMGSMPGGGDPMSSAMAALGGGMMNSEPGTPPPPPSQPPYQPPPAPMIGAGGGDEGEPQEPARPQRPEWRPPVYGDMPGESRFEDRPARTREIWQGAPAAPAPTPAPGGSSSPGVDPRMIRALMDMFGGGMSR